MYTGLKRNKTDKTDKFYTKIHIAQECIDLFHKNIKPNNNDIIIEPSAGNGSFSNIILKKYKKNKTYFYDIDPYDKTIIKQDYLLIKNIKHHKKIHVIGNPPFGRQSSLARKFIKKSAEYADTIAFILPKSFKKDSFKKTFPLNFHLLCEIDLDKNSFIIMNKDHDVPCIFQIWKKKKENRALVKKIEPKYFTYVKKEQLHDFSLRRVGVYAGRIDCDTKDKSFQSHYFIKLNSNINKDTFLKEYNKIEFEHNNTVGPKSISKQQFNKKINKIEFI